MGASDPQPRSQRRRPPPRRQEMHTLDEDGMATFLEASRETPYYALFYLAIYTGMRRSELLALR